MLVSEKQLKKESNFAKKKDTVTLTEGFHPDVINEITKGNILSKDENLDKRKKMISQKAFEPTEFAYERAIGRNDSLYSNFAELIALTKRKVAKIVVIEDGKNTGCATGFMVGKNVLLTNWHVFRDAETSRESEVHFFYEYDTLGHPLSPVIFKFNSARFVNNEALDYCFVEVQPNDVTGKYSLDEIGYLFLDGSLGKIGDENVEKLNIIHHPLGDYKQISIRENTFVGLDETKLFYVADTAQGSSGSPVFNDQWQVVGLHHKSIAKMTPDGENYLDKDDNIIPVTDDDKIDASRIVWLKNEGIRVSVILAHLETRADAAEFRSAIKITPPVQTLSFNINGNNIINRSTMNNDSNNIIISVPPDSLSTDNSIEISLSKKKITSTGVPLNVQGQSGEALFEIAKVDKENGVDFKGCVGYKPNFLGKEVKLPQPNVKLSKEIALTKSKSNELKYFNYSVIFNSKTRMPAISAINVEGDPRKRLDNSKRSDDWLRDVRIDIESQLTDKFYLGSQFDKGHMSRWEDANWADTEAEALRNGIYTCFYTNACPQVVALNRAGGVWGQLEKQVLEKGIKVQAGKQARMTVFNGPVFDDSKDRLFKGVTIPMQFYKIIVWLNDAGELRATGFKLTQEALVDHIKFDESMRIDIEALDIDKIIKFKSYQASIKSLSKLTNINFDQLEAFDTYKKLNGADEMLIVDEKIDL